MMVDRSQKLKVLLILQHNIKEINKMSEKIYDVKTISVDYMCDICKVGKMKFTGSMLASNPPLWKHECDNCGAVLNLRYEYPLIRYERIFI